MSTRNRAESDMNKKVQTSVLRKEDPEEKPANRTTCHKVVEIRPKDSVNSEWHEQKGTDTVRNKK